MSLLSDFAKSVVLGQLRTALPVIGGGVGALGVANNVDPTKLEGALYYLASAAFYIVPAIYSYLQKKSVADLLAAAQAAAPTT